MPSETGPTEERVVPDASELHNPQVEPICRNFLELRYRLLPYNYTLMREACDTGLPPMRESPTLERLLPVSSERRPERAEKATGSLSR